MFISQGRSLWSCLFHKVEVYGHVYFLGEKFMFISQGRSLWSCLFHKVEVMPMFIS